MPLPRTAVDFWLAQLKSSPDARGDIVDALKRYRGFPSVFPNRMFLYRFVRDKLHLITPRQLDAVPALYDEWHTWKKRYDASILDDIPVKIAASG